MARDWRRAVLAAYTAAMLGGACALGAPAQSAEAEADEEKAAASEGARGKRRQDPAEAQRAIEAALKQLRAGRPEQAMQALSATVAGGNLPPAILAKALYVRGMVHRRQGRPAQAVSDLTGALWLRGGLGGDDRAEAIRERSAAYADAGLADPGESKASAAKSASSGNNWLSGFFGGFSGTSASPSSPPPAPKVSASPVDRGGPPPAPKGTAAMAPAWTKTEVHQAPRAPAKAPPPRARPAKAHPPPPEPEEAQAKKAEGRYLVQLGAVRTEAEARALAARAKHEHAAILAARGQSIDRAVFGNMGAFFRVRFGPFASQQETQTVCARLQGSGIDCVPVSK
jgi:cell division septation protein DedD